MKSSLMRRASVVALPVLVSAAWATAASAQAQGSVQPDVPGAGPTPVVTPVAPSVAPSVAPPNVSPGAAPTSKWYDKVKVEGFVDAYASVNFNFPKPQSGSPAPNPGRAFDVNNGFALHWAGVNVSYAPDPVGATVGLRFGPSAIVYNGPDAAPGVGLEYVKQAFVSWKPGGGPVTLDFGKFDTWIGAEVADTQYNMNYTRSTLFFTQPVFHTGLRLDYAVNDMFDIKLYAVNGISRTFDNNSGKTFGATVGIVPAKDFAIYLNYIGGPEQADANVTTDAMNVSTVAAVDGANGRWRHMGDVVADLHFDKARVLLNADYVSDYAADNTKHSFYGANATLGYAVNDQFAIALRGGYTADPDGVLIAGNWGTTGKTSIIDGTLTLAASPTPNLIIKLEPRIDSVTSDGPGYSGSFPKAPGDPLSKTMFTTTLGIVATTN